MSFNIKEGLEISAQTILDTIEAIKKIDTLSDSEKSENIKKANELLRNIIKEKQCRKCQNMCNNVNSCEFCIRTYLINKFGKWTSEDEEIDEWIKDCQKNLLRPDCIIEWIPYGKLQDFQFLSEGGIYHKMRALWTEGRNIGWDVNRQELKRFGPHFVSIKNVSINNPNEEQSLLEIKAHLTLTSSMSPVIRTYGLTKDGNNDYMIVMENVEYNLKSYLQNNISSLTWFQKYKMLQDILESLSSIHENNLIHGDLHSGIVRYSTNREIWVIGDLRFCRPIDKPSNVRFGTVQYVAPERLIREKKEHKGQMTVKSDIYSFAMIMWEVSTGRQPFDGERPSGLSDEIVNGLRPMILEKTPDHYSKLMEKCWDADPLNRPSLENIRYEIKKILDDFYKSPEGYKEMKEVTYLKTTFVQTSNFDSDYVVRPNKGKDIEIIEYDQIRNEEFFEGVGRVSFATMLTNRVAIKTLQFDKSDKSSTLLRELLQQKISRWSHIYNDKNVVEFLGLGIKDENRLFLVMPFANNGNLRNYMKNNKLSFDKKMEIAKDITRGIKALHDNNEIHGNINPTNVLIFDGTAKISNLPLPLENKEFKDKDLYIDDSVFDNIGYIDPDAFFGSNGGYKKNMSTDIYSLGTLLWEIMSERVPYQDDGVFELIKRIKGGDREADIPKIPKEYNVLYKRCWHENSLDRPTINDVYDQLKDITL